MKRVASGFEKILQYKERMCFSVFLIAFFILSLKIIDYSLWHDEITTVSEYVSKGLNGIYFNEHYDPGNQLFFSMILAALLKLFGFSETLMRIPSVIFALLTMVSLYRFLWKVFNEKVALLGATLLLLSTQFWDLSTQARGYSLLFLCVVCSVYSVYFEYETGQKKYSILFYISSFVGVGTFPLFCLWVGGLFIYRIVVRKKAKAIFDAVLVTVACLLFYVPVLGKMIKFFTTSIGSYGVPLKWTEFLVTPLEYLLTTYFDGDVSAIVGLFFLIVVIWGVIHLYKTNKKLAEIITIPTVFTLLIMLIFAVNTTIRYLAFLQIVYMVYLLFGGIKIYSVCANWKWKCLYRIIVLIVGFQIVQPLVIWQQEQTNYSRERFKETCEYILEENSLDTPIVIVSARPTGWKFYMSTYNFSNYIIFENDAECMEYIDSIKDNGKFVLIDHMAYREKLSATYDIEWSEMVERQLMRGAIYVYNVE